MNDVLKKINLFSSSKDTLIIQQQVTDNAEEKKSKTDIKKYTGQQFAPAGKDTARKNMASAELFAQKYSREVPIRRVMAEADSLLEEDVAPSNSPEGGVSARKTSPLRGAGGLDTSENFIVRKDELLDSKNFEVVNLQPNEDANPSDSLLEKVSGIKDKKKTASSIKIEFWQSPINYKGFKMTKNKIVLFGISPEENIKLFHLDNNIFMIHNQNFYKLYFTDDFRQFEKVKAPLNLPPKESFRTEGEK